MAIVLAVGDGNFVLEVEPSTALLVTDYVEMDRPNRVLDLILTQYRESPNLLAVVTAVLLQIEQVFRASETLLDYFDLDTAIGEQLTFVGRQLGFPRSHCVCVSPAVYGIDCDDPTSPISYAGACDPGSWIDCAAGVGELSIDDDEVYRGILKARRYQMLGLYDVVSLTEAMREIWGDSAWVVDSRVGTVIISPGRDLTATEVLQLPIALRALPIAPGIGIAIVYGDDPVLGFGDGWAGPCEGSVPCEELVDPYSC